MAPMNFQTTLKTPAADGLEEFMLINGRYANFTKETFFIRYLSPTLYAANVDKLQGWAMQQPGCVFAKGILNQPSVAETAKYLEAYNGGNIRLPFQFANRLWQEALEAGVHQAIDRFKLARGRSEEAILRNFAVKLLYMIDVYFPQLFVETVKMNRFPKFACSGNIKLAEYLFLGLLFQLGCDVLYISAEADVMLTNPELLGLSQLLRENPHPQPAAAPTGTPTETAPAQGSGRPVISMDRIRRSDRQTVQPAPAAPPAPPAPPQQRPVASAPRPAAAASRPTGAPQQPLEFEELAKFASSVVMLKVFDKNDQCFKSGSGVIINEKGYVLTNFHVVAGGAYYGILLEEETDVFYTNELIKYHPDYDLAVLRMEKHRQPIPISKGERGLVRGQKVVAIGSPLGLFNSVSDGIISGFREMEKVSMVQFTAPVSHGSSGGALLDMYGDLIGLITAGYDDGQNLNLAVGYQTISQFVRGLI